MANQQIVDYIVVGAGSAGCVLTDRLTASGKFQVVVLEAGPRDTNPWIHVPLGYGKLFAMPRINWMYQSEPEPQLKGRSVFTPRGKVIGGSSSINGLVYIRGQREDFDEWARLGNVGWGYDDVLPYFKKAEDQCHGANAFHGKGGPLPVTDLPDKHELADAYIAAAEEIGIPRNDDFNGARQEGAGYFQSTARNGRRVSAAVAYLHPAARRTNLEVLTDSLVTRVLFEGTRAVGVEFENQGAMQTIRARKEVLLCSGSFNSPQLLQLSGVGPRGLLTNLGIPIVHAAPQVGEGLQDHFYARTIWRCSKPITFNDDMRSIARKIGVGLRYLFARRGPLTISAGYAGAFVRTQPAMTRPDIQLYFINFSTDKMGTALHPFPGFTASVSNLRPESRGHVRIRSADPRQPPAIQYNYLSAEGDQRSIVDGLKMVRRMMQTSAMRPYIAGEHLPGEQIHTDADWLDYARDVGGTVYHPTTTCRMGPDDGAVVDTALRVRGVAGLRVIDASIMPNVVSGNTNAAAIMIAEKGADLVLADAARS